MQKMVSRAAEAPDRVHQSEGGGSQPTVQAQ